MSLFILHLRIEFGQRYEIVFVAKIVNFLRLQDQKDVEEICLQSKTKILQHQHIACILKDK